MRAEENASDLIDDREFAVPRELVFEAWTVPEHFARWFAPHGIEVPWCEMDARPGGRYTVGHTPPRACRRGVESDRRATRRVPRTKEPAMARLIYAMNTSLDGYISDRDGKLDWSAPTPELFAAIFELQRPMGTYLYGRHLYETMAVWDTAHLEADGPAFIPGLLELEREFAAM